MSQLSVEKDALKLGEGSARKMLCEHSDPLAYSLVLGDQNLPLNELIGQSLRLEYQGTINCVACNRVSKKSFGQGHCYPCFASLPQCDSCMMSPERCHFDAGTCRDPEWAQGVCFNDHIVYLANSSGIKVGITRATQVPVRWMDQGAIQALPIFRVATRKLSGLVEVIFKEHVADKTNWRKMLKGEVEVIDLQAEAERLMALCKNEIDALQIEHGLQAVEPLLEAQAYDFNYPVECFPTKVVSFNLDKNPVVEGVLKGIKGQYLIFDTGVINIRKYGGYQLALSRLL